MNEFSKSLIVSASGLKAQATRIRHLAENISNADTPGYRRKTVTFETELTQNGSISEVHLGDIQLDQSALKQVYDPSHPLSDETGHYDSSNVELMIEIADSREAQRSYEANLRMFDQARQMSSSLMELLRR